MKPLRSALGGVQAYAAMKRSNPDLFGALLVALGTAVLIVPPLILIRALEQVALEEDRPLVVGIVSVAPLFALALALVGVLLLIFLRGRVGIGSVETLPVFALASAVIIVGIEGFASLTLLLWRHGLVDSINDARQPTLWSVEQVYIWHLAEAVPLVGIPETLGWKEPRLFDDVLPSGVLLTTFSALVILPLVAVVITGYRVVDARGRGAIFIRKGWNQVFESEGVRSRTRGLQLLLYTSSLCASLLLGVLVLRVLVDVSAPFNEWYLSWNPEDVTVFGLIRSEAFPQAIIAFAFAYLALNVFEESDLGDVDSVWDAVRDMCVLIAVVILVMFSTAACQVALAQSGHAATIPSHVAGDAVAAFSYVGWHVADMVPQLDLTRSLNWQQPPYRPTDRWSALLLIVSKAMIVLIITVRVGRLLRQRVERTRE